MSTPAQKANLARIRDNQRRSRARKREYTKELEQRIRVYELQGVEASSEVQQAARRVAEENRQLRVLLNRHGITDQYISHCLHRDTAAAQTDPTPTPHFPLSNPGDAVQSLQHVMAPRRSAPFDPGVPYVVPPQESRETLMTNVSTSSSSPWKPEPAAYPRDLSNDQLLHHSVPSMMIRPSVPPQMHPQQPSCSAASGTWTSHTEAYDSVAA